MAPRGVGRNTAIGLRGRLRIPLAPGCVYTWLTMEQTRDFNPVASERESFGRC